MASEVVTLWVAVTGTIAAMVGENLRVRISRRIATMDHAGKAHARLLPVQVHLQDLEDPEIQEVPFMIKHDEEISFVTKNYGRFCNLADKHRRLIEPLLDTLDTYVRQVVQHYINDYKQARIRYLDLADDFVDNPVPDCRRAR